MSKTKIYIVLFCLLIIVFIFYLYMSSAWDAEKEYLERRCELLCNIDTMIYYGLTPEYDCVCGYGFSSERIIMVMD